MKNDNNFPLGPELIQQILNEKKAKNQMYSLRALSRNLNISQTQLSHILQGKRKLSPHHALKIGEYMNLDDLALLQFIKSTLH